MSNFDKVREFHKTYKCELQEEPLWPSSPTIEMRVNLIEEELLELKEAIANKDIIEVADALTDLLYVVYGAGHTFGLNLDKCFEEVHNSNMSKLGEDNKPIYRSDGKVLKGPGFFQPDLNKIIFGNLK